MHRERAITRRLAVLSGATAGMSAALGQKATAMALPARAKTSPIAAVVPASDGHLSANGWPLVSEDDVASTIGRVPVPGTGNEFAARLGDVQEVLLRVVRRFHYEVVELRPGDIDGFVPAGGSERGRESNLASGTAVRVLAGSFPDGVRGHMTPIQVESIRKIVAECEGVVHWGGDDLIPAPSYFVIGVGPSNPRLTALAAGFRRDGQTASPVVGALA